MDMASGQIHLRRDLMTGAVRHFFMLALQPAIRLDIEARPGECLPIGNPTEMPGSKGSAYRMIQEGTLYRQHKRL
jgi:hypothetical protein